MTRAADSPFGRPLAESHRAKWRSFALTMSTFEGTGFVGQSN
jgi:hypothetical protein